LNTQ